MNSNPVREQGSAQLGPGVPADLPGRAPNQGQQSLQAILDTTSDGYWLVRSDGRIAEVNASYCRMSGYSREELLTMSVDQIDVMEDAARVGERIAQVQLVGNSRFCSKHRTRNGRVLDLEISLTVVPATGDIVSFFRDVTEQLMAEKALRMASAALEQSAACIVITDTQGTIEYVNPAFTRVTGYPLEEAVGQNPRILKSGGQGLEVYQALWDTVLAGRTWAGKLCNRRKDGSLYWEQATISPLRDEAGLITHLVASKLDITEMVVAAEARQVLEEQMTRTQKLESLGSLAGGLAHDMNNVLGAILGLASVHQVEQPQGSALRRDMDTIVKACERGGTLVKGLLGFTRQGLPEAQAVDLNGLVRDGVALLSRTTLQRCRLEVALAEGLPPVLGDASALSHALMNLCVNGVDAMGTGGTLTLRTFFDEGAGFVGLEVADTGCGMSKEVQSKALDPFFTTKPQGKGTGLGLPIVYGTVKAHRGHLELDSQPGQGTRIRLFLPALREAAASTSMPPEEELPNQTLAVLVVDDDELLQVTVKQMLSVLGHRPTLAATGEAALDLLAAGLHPDLVILDLNMPGMGGAAALPRIRELRPDVPVLIATGRVDQEALDLLVTFPGVNLMPKPFSLSHLKQHLLPLLRQDHLSRP